MEESLLTRKSTETTVMADSEVDSMLFILKMVRHYLLVHWSHFCQIHGIEKEQIRAWKHEKGLQVWERQMFFRPTERGKERGSLKEKLKSEKNKAQKRAWRGKQGRKATLTATGKSRIPLCFIPVRKQEESVWPLSEPHWHFTATERANEPLRRHRRHH